MLRGMPPSVQFAFESRTRGIFVVVVVCALVGTGIISIQWQDGRPQVEFHADRAEQVKGQIVQHVRDARQQYEQKYRDAYDDEPLGEIIDEYTPPEWRTSRLPTTRPARY